MAASDYLKQQKEELRSQSLKDEEE